MSLRKLFLALGLLLLIGVWGACVEIPNGPGTNISPNFRSQVRFVNAVVGNNGDIKVDGVVVGTLSFSNATAYLDIASGSRSLQFANSAAVATSFGSEQQSTLVIYAVDNATTGYLNLVEGHKDKNNGSSDTATTKVKFVNVAQGAASNVTFLDGSATGTSLAAAAGVGFATAPQYGQITKGSHAIYGVSAGGYNLRYLASTSRSTGNATADLTAGSGFVYSVTVKSENSKGLYRSASINNADSGVVGSSVFTVSTDSQNVSLPSKTLTGAAENPPVTTNSTGTALWNLNNKTGFSYNITVTRDNSRGFFTGAHFHASSLLTTNGPVFYPFDVKKQTVNYPVDSLKGANEVPASTSTASGLGTFVLYPDSLTYNIVINRDPVDTNFTAMHLHNAAAGVVGGVVKDITLTPWSSATKSFAGTWKRTDATQPLTDAMITELIAGRIYLNAHTTVRPAGAVRSQLKNVPTSVNNFAGVISSTSSTPLRPSFADTIAKGWVYVNFHTTTNPGGEIRAQCVPDTFTTSTLTGTWSGTTLTNALKEQFNLGRMYFNLKTATDSVRMQLKVDASKGQYGVAKLDSAVYEIGKIYTVIATGKGGLFQLIRLADRQVAGTPVGKPSVIEPKKAVVKRQQD